MGLPYNKGCEPNAKDATKPLVLRIWYLSPNRKPNSPLEQPTLEEETTSTISKMK
jgi:hypothetical protein